MTKLEKKYSQYEMETTYHQHKLDSINQKTPVWKEIKGDSPSIAEIGQTLSFNIYDTKLEHPESITGYSISIEREYNGKTIVTTYSSSLGNAALTDNENTRVTNFVYIDGESVELTDEEKDRLCEESVLN